MKTNWKPQVTSDLFKLKKEKYSASQIAKRLNAKHGTELTRSAVLGKVWRIKQVENR